MMQQPASPKREAIGSGKWNLAYSVPRSGTRKASNEGINLASPPGSLRGSVPQAIGGSIKGRLDGFATLISSELRELRVKNTGDTPPKPRGRSPSSGDINLHTKPCDACGEPQVDEPRSPPLQCIRCGVTGCVVCLHEAPAFCRAPPSTAGRVRLALVCLDCVRAVDFENRWHQHLVSKPPGGLTYISPKNHGRCPCGAESMLLEAMGEVRVLTRKGRRRSSKLISLGDSGMLCQPRSSMASFNPLSARASGWSEAESMARETETLRMAQDLARAQAHAYLVTRGVRARVEEERRAAPPSMSKQNVVNLTIEEPATTEGSREVYSSTAASPAGFEGLTPPPTYNTYMHKTNTYTGSIHANDSQIDSESGSKHRKLKSTTSEAPFTHIISVQEQTHEHDIGAQAHTSSSSMQEHKRMSTKEAAPPPLLALEEAELQWAVADAGAKWAAAELAVHRSAALEATNIAQAARRHSRETSRLALSLTNGGLNMHDDSMLLEAAEANAAATSVLAAELMFSREDARQRANSVPANNISGNVSEDVLHTARQAAKEAEDAVRIANEREMALKQTRLEAEKAEIEARDLAAKAAARVAELASSVSLQNSDITSTSRFTETEITSTTRFTETPIVADSVVHDHTHTDIDSMHNNVSKGGDSDGEGGAMSIGVPRKEGDNLHENMHANNAIPGDTTTISTTVKTVISISSDVRSPDVQEKAIYSTLTDTQNLENLEPENVQNVQQGTIEIPPPPYSTVLLSQLLGEGVEATKYPRHGKPRSVVLKLGSLSADHKVSATTTWSELELRWGNDEKGLWKKKRALPFLHITGTQSVGTQFLKHMHQSDSDGNRFVSVVARERVLDLEFSNETACAEFGALMTEACRHIDVPLLTRVI